MIKNILVKVFNKANQLESLLLTTFYKLLFKRVGSMRIWGRIKVMYPQNITVGNNCSINFGTVINAYNPVTIGNNVTISANTMIISTGIDINLWACGYNGDKHIKNDGIYIGENVWIGANSMILGGGKNNWKKCGDCCRYNSY